MKLFSLLALLLLLGCSSGGGSSAPAPAPYVSPPSGVTPCTQTQVGTIAKNPVTLQNCPGATTSLIIEGQIYPGVGICGSSPDVTRLPNLGELVFCIGGNTDYATYPYPVGVASGALFQYTGQPMTVNDPGYGCTVTWSGCTATASELP